MTHLSESTSMITTVINSDMQDYIQWTTQSMLDGNTIIYNNDDGTSYELTAEQMDVFNPVSYTHLTLPTILLV